MSHRSPISQRRLEQLRAAKRPTQADKDQAMREFPNDIWAAAMRADEIAYRRRVNIPQTAPTNVVSATR